ncbi:MAG: alpha/beta hydrolase [Actinomycetota bacterium]|nr:alpha/beta hydrolase [Actinomycetota bacterium]
MTTPLPGEDWGRRDPAWSGIHGEVLQVRGRPAHVLRRAAHGAGPPLLLVHGLGGSARNWLDVATPLSRHGEVVAVDLPGFGSTPVPEGGSARVRANARFLAAVLDHLGWRDATVIGNSMGGLLITLLAADRPDQVGRLVLINPALPAPRRDMLRLPPAAVSRILPAAVPGIGRALIELGYRRRTAEQLVDDSLASVLADVERIRPALRDVLIENLEVARTTTWRRRALSEAARSLVAMLVDAREPLVAVHAVAAPTLVVAGDLDRLVSAHVIRGLMVRRPDWDHHVLADVGHSPHVEVPRRFCRVVEGWLVDAAAGR